MLRACFFITGVLFLAFFAGCSSTPDVSGKWEVTFFAERKGIGKINMEFVLNIREDQKYSITTRGTSVKTGVSKIFSHEVGVWEIKAGMITFYPRVCKEIDEYFDLEEIVCKEPDTEKIVIKDGRWQFTIEEGKTLGLARKPS